MGSFELALGIQLRPYKIGIRRQTWTPSAALQDQVRQARQRASRSGAIAAVWFASETRGARDVLRLQLLDLRQPEQLRSVDVGRLEAGIERSLAVAARTLLVAGPSARRDTTTTGPPKPPPQRPPRRAPSRVAVGLGYGVEIFPVGDELRHGPHLGLALRVWRGLETQLLVGYRALGADQDGAATWARAAVRLVASARYAWPVSRRWSVLAGLSLRTSAIHVEATSGVTGRTDQAWLWELAAGPTGGVAVTLWRRLSLELTACVAWVGLGHQVLIQGSDVARSGRVELALMPLLRWGL